jgi:glycosyltransferase involved in cell wall biosynthesis
MRPLHILFLFYVYEPDVRTAEGLLDRYSTVRPWARALRAEGAEVTVLLRFWTDVRLEDQGICFDFRSDAYGPKLAKWQLPRSLHSVVQTVYKRHSEAGAAGVVHVHGLFYPLQMRALRSSLPSGCAIVAQHHAERPWRRIGRPLQKCGLRVADGFFFAAPGLARSWVEQGLISERQRIFQVMEGSTEFRREDRPVARATTRLSGNPVVLWVGRLIPLKGPLTVLEGFERILAHLPAARLYMAYGDAELLPAVRDRIASSPLLTRAVTLLGTVPHPQLERIYNSADYFVLGSHYEGSSFSLVEAMACGVVPVVTDIPSFRVMTDDGRIGSCWAPGSSTGFAEAFLEIVRKPLQPLSDQAVRFFYDQLSYPAIARQSIRAYEEVASSRAGKRP